MATLLTKPVIRHTMDGKVVSLHPDGMIGFRHKGRKTTYYVSMSKAYQMAIYEHLLYENEQKKQNYKVRKAMGQRVKRVTTPSFHMFAKMIRQIYSVRIKK